MNYCSESGTICWQFVNVVVQIALAMASRAKMLLQELKTVKGDVIFLGNRCSQLEEENKRLRESMVKGVREEDDLVSLA